MTPLPKHRWAEGGAVQPLSQNPICWVALKGQRAEEGPVGENGRRRVEEDRTWLQMGGGVADGAGGGSGRRWVADNESSSGGRPATGGDQH